MAHETLPHQLHESYSSHASAVSVPRQSKGPEETWDEANEGALALTHARSSAASIM